MTDWAKTGETTQDYLYNADGIRVRVTPSGGTATDFLLDGRQIAEEITGASVVSYVRPGLICSISSTTRTIYHGDGIGSTRATTNSSEAVQEVDIRDAYGNKQSGFSITSNFAYAGKYRYYADATGLDYLKARYYDPMAGRFISRDPLGYADGLNCYAYAKNAPTVYLDLSGNACTPVTDWTLVNGYYNRYLGHTEERNFWVQAGSENAGDEGNCWCLWQRITVKVSYWLVDHWYTRSLSCMTKDKCGNWQRWTETEAKSQTDSAGTTEREVPSIGPSQYTKTPGQHVYIPNQGWTCGCNPPGN